MTDKAMVTDEALFNALADAYENGARWRDRYGDLEFLGKAAYDYADKNCPPAALAQAETQPVPRMENCGTYLAKDNKDQWHYLNHAGNWCGYQGPITTTETHPPPQSDALRTALQEQVNACHCDDCEMCHRHQALLDSTDGQP